MNILKKIGQMFCEESGKLSLTRIMCLIAFIGAMVLSFIKGDVGTIGALLVFAGGVKAVSKFGES